MIADIVDIVHGVHTAVDDGEWMEELKAYLDLEISNQGRGDEMIVLIHRYNPFGWGYFTSVGKFLATFLPTMTSERWRRKQVEAYQKRVADIRRRYGPGVKIHVVGHSFAGFKVVHSMTLQTSQPKTFFGRVVLFGPAFSSRFMPGDAEGHFEQLHVFYSKNDSVISLSPIGQAGYAGLQWADDVVMFNHDATPLDHNDYFAVPYFEQYKRAAAGILLN